MIKQLGKHIQRCVLNSGSSKDSFVELASANSAVKSSIIQKVNSITATYNTVTDYDITLEKGQLSLIFDFERWKDTSTNFIKELSNRLDQILDIVTQKGILQSLPKIQGYQSVIQRKTDVNCTIVIDWERWVHHKNFTSLTIPKQLQIHDSLINERLNDIINGPSSFCEVYKRCQPAMQACIKTNIQKIIVALDPTNRVNDAGTSGITGHSKLPHFRLDYFPGNKVLLVEANLSSMIGKNGWDDFAIKILPFMNSLFVRLTEEQTINERAGAITDLLFSDDPEKKFEINIDWHSFMNSKVLLDLPPKDMEQTIQAIRTVHITHLTNMLKKICKHHLGKEALQKQITNCRIVIIKEFQKVEGVAISVVGTTISLEINWNSLRVCKKNWAPYQLRHALGVTITVAKSKGEKVIAGHIAAMNKVYPNIKVVYDWSYLEDGNFLSLYPNTMKHTIKNASGKFVGAVLISGLVGVSTHPIGKSNIDDRIKTVNIAYYPFVSEISTSHGKHTKTDSKMEIDGETLVVKCNVDTLKTAIRSPYKERVEFEYDLIVAIAYDNAMAGYNKGLENLRKQLNNSKVLVTVDVKNFSTLQTFREDLSPKTQSDIIMSFCSALPQTVFSNFNPPKHKLLVDTFNSKIEKVEFILDPTNSAIGFSSEIDYSTEHAQEPNFQIVDKVLKITSNMTEIEKLTLGQKWPVNWKHRFVDILDLTVEIVKIEKERERTQITNDLNTCLAHSQGTIVEIDWAGFTKTKQFLNYHPDEQYKMLETANTTMLSTTLLGKEAIAHNKGLTEFQEVIDVLHKNFKDILFHISVEDKDVVYVQIKDNTLHITYTLSQLKNSSFKGCYREVEKLLTLTTLIKDCAVARGTALFAQQFTCLVQKIPNVNIFCNWSVWVPALGGDYVATIDSVASLLVGSMVSKRCNGWGDHSLNQMLEFEKNLLSIMQRQVTAIELRMDATNKTSKKFGRSRTLNTSDYDLSVNNGTLVIQLNLRCIANRYTFGVGRIAQFFFDSNTALSLEQNEVRRIANEMRRDEEESRRRDIERWNRDNEDINKENKRNRETYQREMERYNKDLKEKCNYSQCGSFGARPGQTKCGVCQGKGQDKGKTCHSCKGRGSFDCNNCKGTTLKYPNGLNPPREPSVKDPKPMPTFPPMRNFEAEI